MKTERLTENKLLTESDLYKMEIDCELETVAKWHNKLHDLEDIEQKLDTDIRNDLSKLLLASKNGFWVKKGYTNIKTHKAEYQLVFHDYAYFYYANDTECWWIATIDNSYPLYLYGKTWALTREELEK